MEEHKKPAISTRLTYAKTKACERRGSLTPAKTLPVNLEHNPDARAKMAANYLRSASPETRSSSSSQAHSTNSATRPFLDHSNKMEKLDPPYPPFGSYSLVSANSSRGASPGLPDPANTNSSSVGHDIPARPFNSGLSSCSSAASLTINYVPNKFSSGVLIPRSTSPRKRRNRLPSDGPEIPKMGGGVDAFKRGEARMGVDDEDDGPDQQSSRWFGPSKGRKGGRGRWNRFKWTLLASNILLTLYSLTALIVCFLVWFDVFNHADIIRVGNRAELVISTLAATLGIFTAILGWAGILLNNRSFLAIYTFLLWIVFIFLVIPGYMSYKRRTFNLEGKINHQWSRSLGAEGRMRIQNQLQCCGYFSPFVEATISQTCYARSILPGCKLGYLQFERRILKTWYTIIFALVPFHLFVVIAGLLCSNHVTYRFGKGMMPKAYRLSLGTMAVIMDNYANQLVEHYGTEVATEILDRSRSTLQLDNMPMMPDATPSGPPPLKARKKQTGYNSLNTAPPLDSDDNLR